MRTYLGLIALGVALVVPASLRAQDQLVQSVLKIHGVVAADEASAEKIGYDAISVNFVKTPAKQVKWIGVVQCTNEVGDPFTGKNILDQIVGPQPTMLIDGTPDQVKVLADAPVGAKVTFQGQFVQDSRNLLLSSAAIVPASGAKTK
jgi:hypothetical protein